MPLDFDASFPARSEHVQVNSFCANVVALLHRGIVVELGDETPLAVDPAEQLDDELDDSTLPGPNAVPQFAAGI